MTDYPGASTTKRSSAVKIMLHPDMAQKLRVLADHLGQTPATLASIAVSQYVAQQTVALEATKGAVKGFFDHIAPEVLSELQKLLGEVPKGRQFQGVEKLQNPADFFNAGQPEQSPAKARSASQTLAEALRKSAALVKAEEKFDELSMQQLSERPLKGSAW